MRIILVLLLSINSQAFTVAIAENATSVAPRFKSEINELYKRIGKKVQIQVLPSSRALKLFKEGEVDALGARVHVFSDFYKNALLVSTPLLEDITHM